MEQAYGTWHWVALEQGWALPDWKLLELARWLGLKGGI